MNVVDSSGWLEYFVDGPNASVFKRVLQSPDQLLVPTICMYEVFKRLLSFVPVEKAAMFVEVMRQGHTVALDESLALQSALIARQHQLALADAIIYTTVITNNATLWTQNAHFKGLDNVQFIEKK